jgi:diguanylate cyclase (GGDEF)-like protein/PAS domain S-box-containing protein
MKEGIYKDYKKGGKAELFLINAFLLISFFFLMFICDLRFIASSNTNFALRVKIGLSILQKAGSSTILEPFVTSKTYNGLMSAGKHAEPLFAELGIFLAAKSDSFYYWLAVIISNALLVAGGAAFVGIWNKRKSNKLKEILSLADNIPFAVFFCSACDYSFVQASKAFYKMLGYSPSEIKEACGNNLLNLIYAPDREAFKHAIETGLKLGDKSQTECRLTKKDGSLISVRFIYNMAESGSICFAAEDITNWSADFNSADNLKMIVDELPGGLARISLDDNLSIMMANAAFYDLCGYAASDFSNYLQGGMFNIIDSRDRPKLFKKIAAAQENAPIITEFRVIKKDGKSLWLSMHARKCPAEDGNTELLCVFTDISSLREAYNQAKTDREKARTLAAMATDIIFEYSVQTDELHFTGNKLLDLPVTIPQFSKKLTSSDALCPDSVGKLQSLLSARFQPGKVETEEINIRSLDGAVSRWYNIYAYMIMDGSSSVIIGKLADITERKQEIEALIEASRRDPLTNLYNIPTTKYYIENFLKQLTPSDKRLHAFMVLDIDNFKNFNDILGHAIGDSVLIDISQKINSVFRKSDIIGRVGGDEFVLLVKDFENIEQIKAKAQEVCDKFENIYFGNNYKNLKLSVSIGIALAGKDGNTYSALFEKADIALYKVKTSGKNSYAFYS